MDNTNNPIILDIYTSHHSFGLLHDVDVIKNAVSQAFGDQVKVRSINVPFSTYNSPRPNVKFPKHLGRPGDIAIFIEHAFSADFLNEYAERALFINPEWFTSNDKIASEEMVNTVLHKSRYYYATLPKLMPLQRHVYTGFTSIDPCETVNNYDKFSHFRGAARRRLTQELIDIWQKNPLAPLLRVQCYGADVAVNTNAWVGAGNTHFYFGKFERNAYFRELAQAGIHLCTTQVEGFGHFVNEARAMSALTIVLDAPPMNELITPECGILVPTSASRPIHLGLQFNAEPRELVNAISRALSMPVAERERMGQAARTLYEQQAAEFRQALWDYLNPIVHRIQKSTAKGNASPQGRLYVTNNQSSNAQVFDNIYRKNAWGKSPTGESVYSGPGSHEKAIVTGYVDALTNVFAEFETKPSVVDIGCGDFSVGERVRHLFSRYTACDVSQVVLDHCRQRYTKLDVDFRHLDAAREDLPDGDVILIRQVLQHLDNASIDAIVRKMEGSYKYAIITEHLPREYDFPSNMDKLPGPGIRMQFGSGVVLTDPPFSMKFKHARELLSMAQFGGRIVTTLYEL